MRRLATLVALFLAVSGCAGDGGSAASFAASETTSTTVTSTLAEASAFAPDGPGRWDGEILSGGKLRRFVLHVPEHALSPAPLVVVLHGFSGEPEDAETLSAMHEVAEAAGFLVVYPAAAGVVPAWKANSRFLNDEDVAFLEDVVDLVAEVLPIDSDRVFVAGMSNGGGMAARAGCEAGAVFAAVASVAGAQTTRACRKERAVPLIAFHGTEDDIVPYDGAGFLMAAPETWAAGWALGNGCRAEPSITLEATGVFARSWTACRDSAGVVLYTIEGGRHGWPGSDRATKTGDSTTAIDASEIIWSFFAAHPMP